MEGNQNLSDSISCAREGKFQSKNPEIRQKKRGKIKTDEESNKADLTLFELWYPNPLLSSKQVVVHTLRAL